MILQEQCPECKQVLTSYEHDCLHRNQKERMKHIMVDLETLGRAAGCVVLSIGAVKFSPEGIGEEFYEVLNVDDQLQLGLTIEPSTQTWWESQSETARSVLTAARIAESSMPLGMALSALDRFMTSEPTGASISMNDVRIWGNGASFDNPILTGLYMKARGEVPWKFWNERCYRTLSALVPHKRRPRGGTLHNALDDARNQAKHAVELIKEMERLGVAWRD